MSSRIKAFGRIDPMFAICLAAVLAAVSTGCGDGRPERVPVTGRVLIDGKPLQYGQIRFHAENHRPAFSNLSSDGRFELSTYEPGDGSVLGRHAVTVNAAEVLSPTAKRWHAPKKYNNATTSEIVVEVVESSEPVEIKLTWDGGKPFTERVAGGGD
jgi:hypothetical protein